MSFRVRGISTVRGPTRSKTRKALLLEFAEALVAREVLFIDKLLNPRSQGLGFGVVRRVMQVLADGFHSWSPAMDTKYVGITKVRTQFMILLAGLMYVTPRRRDDIARIISGYKVL